GTTLYQIKGSTYTLRELLGVSDSRVHANGSYVTLRLTSGMYHRFHAPHDCCVERVTHIPGDMWNVNPIALKRIDRLFCRNERAVIQMRLGATGQIVTLVPIAAILVPGIRLTFLELPLATATTRASVACDARFSKGEEMGWFEHGSTIVFLAPSAFEVSPQ